MVDRETTATAMWPQLSEIVDQALDLPKHRRVPWLRQRCGNDAELLAKASALLALDTEALDRQSQPIVSLRSPKPESIGPYEVLEEIGYGGMATVYLARDASGEDTRPVAIKVLHRGFERLDVERRFRLEAQILDRFRHPHIAALFAAGKTEDGRPYLVMERVQGEPIDHFCTRRKLGLRGTIRLFQRVCRAVSHAHRNLVVHRDLKPSNILVTEDGEPKLLDFGIAELLDPDLGQQSRPADRDAAALTPQYASPEQLAGAPATTSCDVYSLGIVLYELLTGRRPVGSSDGVAAPSGHEQAMTLPSQALGTLGDSRDRRRRGWRLHGDLDAIMLKALAPEAGERYASVEQFEADLDRHLADLPVHARPTGGLYRFGKLLRRQRRAVAATLVIALALGWFVGERERQRREIRDQRDKALAMQEFLFDVFGQADPRQGFTGRSEVREVLHSGVERIDQLDDQPALQGDFAQVLGQVYFNLGIYEDGQALLDRALALHSAQRGPSSPEVAATRDLLGQLLAETDDLEASADHLEKALVIRRAERPQDPEALAAVINNLALTRHRQGQQAEAERLARESLTLRRSVWGDDHLETAIGLHNLGYVLMNVESIEPSELIDLFSAGLEIRLRQLDENHPDVAVSRNNLGAALISVERYAEAEEQIRQAVEVWRSFLGDDHINVFSGKLNQAMLRFKSGDAPAALAMLEPLRDRMLEILGPDHFLSRGISTRIDEVREAAQQAESE